MPALPGQQLCDTCPLHRETELRIEGLEDGAPKTELLLLDLIKFRNLAEEARDVAVEVKGEVRVLAADMKIVAHEVRKIGERLAITDYKVDRDSHDLEEVKEDSKLTLINENAELKAMVDRANREAMEADKVRSSRRWTLAGWIVALLAGGGAGVKIIEWFAAHWKGLP